ncbi:YggS family pyridoxal phosphate-dependent enzyme [Halanaerobium hydrogeniformans]|uniref:Pyridoxal phosphate homeostasis protein n=1 Tax=Halanaerobium hydrogeniformans TaxID=656519 RepID=E4RLV9_HALHG|nr:YggS family pyridoxal phosphate-dependent enzyme [Halanaerobium hydrogeniformans]ADQ15023.1 alanine racemase domain protein [Halanaerobium hydrogeniformans]
MNEENLRANYQKIDEKIRKAAERSGRKREDIKLLAVSKTQSSAEIKALKELGVCCFGENRVQELEEKDAELKSEDIVIDWHFVGHLQRNKVKYLMRMENCKMIESVDSFRLAKEVNKRARKNDRIIPVLIQINIAEDDNKYGIKAENAEDFFKKIIKFKNLEIKGLMTILPYLDDEETLRKYFKELKNLFDYLSENIKVLTELSMGMTNDYQIAIEEGATIVRIGRALFGEREY